MLRAGTTTGSENRIPFSITWAGADPVSSGAKASRARSTRGAASRELSLSGYQLLFGSLLLVGFAGVFLWALRLWLFEL
jgi:hypothetical protein